MSDYETPDTTVEIEIPQPSGYAVLHVAVSGLGAQYIDEDYQTFLGRLRGYRQAFNSARDHRDRLEMEAVLFFEFVAIGSFEEQDGQQVFQRVVTYPGYLTYKGVCDIVSIGRAWLPHGPLPQAKVPVIVKAQHAPHPHLKRR